MQLVPKSHTRVAADSSYEHGIPCLQAAPAPMPTPPLFLNAAAVRASAVLVAAALHSRAADNESPAPALSQQVGSQRATCI